MSKEKKKKTFKRKENRKICNIFICGTFRWIKVIATTFFYSSLVYYTYNILNSKTITNSSFENFFSEKIISIILLLIGTLYYFDIIVSLYKQTKDCRFDYLCQKSYSISEYLKHSVVIFFLAFSLGVLGSLEVISHDTENVELKDNTEYVKKLQNCIEDFRIIYGEANTSLDKDKSYHDILYCNKILAVSLISDSNKEASEIVYLFYNILQNVLIALIAIELTTAYFVSGHTQSQSLVTGLLIAAIIDIISFVTLKTVVAQPSLPFMDIPRYHLEVGIMLGILSFLSYLALRLCSTHK